MLHLKLFNVVTDIVTSGVNARPTRREFYSTIT